MSTGSLDIPISPDFARSIAPAKITVCKGVTEDDVRDHLAAALQVSLKVQYRLVRLVNVADEAARAAEWQQGPEDDWFLDYSERKLRKLTQTFDRASRILSDGHLHVICDPEFYHHGEAFPAIMKIRVGQPWITDTDRHEKIQTFVHEATHIAGRYVAHEDDWYGRKKAKSMARETQKKRPMKVMRSADNYGYYAIEIALSSIFDL